MPRTRLLALRRAARDLFQVLEPLAREGRHPVTDLLAAAPKAYTTFTRYPGDGVGDATDQCAWYYHAHDPTETRPWLEHGHFHCFAYTERLPPSAKPLALPADPDRAAGGLVHLVALCVNAEGLPDRLFTLNRWASDEWLYPAEHVVPLIDTFHLNSDRRFAPTSAWLSALLRLLQPQIAWLLHERDAVLRAAQARDPEGFSEDPALEIPSMLNFDLDQHLAALDRALERLQSRTR